ncbi:MAG: biotin/lipoyl-containing protein, partial [Bacteroidota bacterium]
MSIVEMKVPVIGESVTEVTLSEWLKADGDYVELDEPICEFESDKATLEFPAEAAGRIIHVAADGDDLEIGALVAKIDTSAAADGGSAPKEEPAAAPAAKEEAAPAPAAAATENYATGTPSPAAGKILREADVDPTTVNGTGRDGRITKEDAQQAAAAPKPAPAKPAPAPAAAPQTAVPATASFSREERTEKMSRMRRTIATRLVRAKNETAMLTTFNEVDLSEVMA